MLSRAGKHVLKPGTSSVFIGGRTARAAISWRLDVREDARGQKQFFSKRKRPGAERTKFKLFHYISAGGMRQLRRTTDDDVIEDRRRTFLMMLVVCVAVWLVFYFLPCA